MSRKPSNLEEDIRYEYKNVSGVIQFLSYTDDNGERIPIQLRPDQTVWFTEQDLRRYKRDERFVKGRIVPLIQVSSESEMKSAENIMTDLQIQFFVQFHSTAKTLEMHMRKVTSITTLARIRDECKRQDKPISFIDTVDRRIERLQEDERLNRKL